MGKCLGFRNTVIFLLYINNSNSTNSVYLIGREQIKTQTGIYTSINPLSRDAGTIFVFRILK